MKLKFGELHATTLCHYNSFAEVVSQALGGGAGDGGEEVNDLAKAPSFEAAIANINAALTM